MANKSKASNQKVINYLDLFYMTPEEVSAKDIAELLQAGGKCKINLWKEMNILELELPNQNPVDFEPIAPSFQEPSDASFIKNRNIKTIFAINLNEDDLKAALPCFEQIVDKFNGFVCSDSADFNPVYAGSSLK